MELLRNKLQASRAEGTPLTIFFIDVNNLKNINDKYGHIEGDLLIKTICEVLKSCICEKDVLFRYGGDEFVVAFPHKHEQEAELIWSDIKNKLENISLNSTKPYSFSASHGTFEFNSTMDCTIDEMLNIADKKMYEEKNVKILDYKL